jgi:hypothetical protein
MHPKVQVPDPTERLIDKIKDYVEANGARFLVGLQTTDDGLVRHLQATHVPFVAFDGADAYSGIESGAHWTPEGHKFVAKKLYGLLSANGVIEASPRR